MTEHERLNEKKVKKQWLGNRKFDPLMKLAVYLLPCRIEDLEKNNLNSIGLKCSPNGTILGVQEWVGMILPRRGGYCLPAFSLNPQYNTNNTVIPSILKKKT